MAENAKIKIGFLKESNTLCIYNGANRPEYINVLFAETDELEGNSIETDLYNVPDIKNLYKFLTYNGSVILNKWNIKIDDIIIIDNDKVAFKAALYIAFKNIDLQKEILFDWKNITFKNTVNMIFDTKGMIVTMHNCEFQGYVNFHNSIFDKSADFRGAEFKKAVSFDGVKFFGYGAYFSNCEFQGYVDFRDSKFEKSAYFRRAKFKNGVDFRDSKFEKSANFREAKFEKAANFYRVTFSGDRANFSDCEFQDNVLFGASEFYGSANFRVAKFKNNAYFNNSIFNKSADFRVANFEKVANFYGVNFNKVPNFSQAIFKGSLNLVNTNLNFDFKNVEDKINEAKEDEKVRIQTANDFRDSFRNFKSALIKDNNLLDASNFHKVELYCKEIELGYKKPPIFSKDWIDKIQLLFYRYISDHHTNLVKIIHNTILMIGFFAWLFCIAHNLDSVNSFLNDSPSYWLFYGFSLIMQQITLIVIGLCMFILYFSTKPLRASTSVCMYFGFIGLIWINPKCIFGIANLFNSATQITPIITPIQNILMTIYSIVAFIFIFSLQKTARRNSIIPN